MLTMAIFVNNSANTNEAAQGDPGYFIEEILVSVDCSVATVYIGCRIRSNASMYIHYPSEVNMSDTHLENSIHILVWFNTTESNLVYTFNNTDPETATTNADAVTPSISSAFDVTFTWHSTNPSAQQVEVTYTGGSIPNLDSYIETLKLKCLKSDLGGFSDVFSSLVAKSSKSTVGLDAYKNSGTFDWVYRFIVSYVTDIAVGTGNHTINVLNLLGVSSLSPSGYARVDNIYVSNVTLNIDSTSPISFISCEPPEVFPPVPYQRGWNIHWNPTDPNKLQGVSYFGDDPTPVSPLTLTFHGTIVPEFTPLTMVITLLFMAAWFLVVRKRLSAKRIQTRR